MVVRRVFDGCSKDCWGFSLFSSNLCCRPSRLPVALGAHPMTGTRTADARPQGAINQDGLNAKARRSRGAEQVKLDRGIA